MPLRTREQVIFAVDIGSTKIAAAAARVGGGAPELLGTTTTTTRGMRGGSVVDLVEVSQAVRQAVGELGVQTNLQPTRAVVSVNARGMKGFNSIGHLNLGPAEMPVTDEHVRKCQEAARKVALSANLEPLHYAVRRILVDGQLDVDNPRGMIGSKLEVSLHILTLPRAQIAHFTKAANGAGLSVSQLVVQPLAAAEAALLDEEREFGAVLLDVGASASSVLVFQKGKIQHGLSVPIGGDSFTRDLVVGLRTTLTEAERIKCSYGSTEPASNAAQEVIEVQGTGSAPPRRVTPDLLAEIVRPRAEELLELVRDELWASGFESSHFAALVLTGGGAQLHGFVSAAERTFDIPARLGAPRWPGGWPAGLSTPAYAALAGLLLRAAQPERVDDAPGPEIGSGRWTRAANRVRGWFQDMI